MSWSVYRWVWELKSPLHIGMSPAGALNRTRLYIPARAIWGAVTAQIARKDAAGFPDYRAEGEKIKGNLRFTYLYPAEKIGVTWCAWLPRYQEGKNLVWRKEDRNDDQNDLPDRIFRMRLLSTRPGTAIDPSSDSALEGTLRETEVINPYWHKNDRQGVNPVAMVGYVFFRSEGIQENIQNLRVLTIGGDTRYGLGYLEWTGEFQKAKDVFGKTLKNTNTNKDPAIETDCLLGHGRVESPSSREMTGQYELVAGWDYGTLQRFNSLLWVPGSRYESSISWHIDEQGYWYPDSS